MILNNIKHIIVSFIVAIITIFFVYGGYSMYAASSTTDFAKFYAFVDEPDENGFILIKSKYHSNMNDYFNHKFEELVKLIDSDPKFYENEKFKAPKSDTNITEVCKTNVSTYCTAMGAMDIYIAYLNKLNRLKGSVPKITSSSNTIKAVIDLVETRGSEIDKDSKDARTVLEGAVNVYKEFQSAYPMHKKYRDIINNLTKYKIALEKIRVQTDQFPTRFVDVTSTNCE